ncbi:hypothetical protein [Alteribacter aurantiacus]|uniref:hypothetical protein n=1 Tax=Alteribacter aurantiacus TaxID=254410 RepID=UPI0003F8566B|nr:hypothetical protein [Alteribacter aurantiacus]
MGIRFIKSAIIYFAISVAIVMYMTLTGDTAPFHLFIYTALFGWATLALTGIIFHFFPKAGENKLAHLHFWLYNGSLAFFLTGHLLDLFALDLIFPLLQTSITLLAASTFVFLYNVYLNVRKRKRR